MLILDLGTGSGAIALAIARERPLCHVVATDISEGALSVARLNARQMTIPNVEFFAGSWIEPVAGREFDLIVSNPPYVASDDPHLSALKHEPVSALVSGEEGLDAILEIASTAMSVLRQDGELLVEHGAEQADAVAAILGMNGWAEIRTARDLAGNARVSIARKRQPA